MRRELPSCWCHATDTDIPGAVGAAPTASPRGCTAPVPAPFVFFPELSSWCPAGTGQHEPSSITVLVSGEPLSPPRPSGTALRSGRAAVPRAAGEFNAINNPPDFYRKHFPEE